MATYFVASAGNDGNAGTSSGAAWQTLTKVTATTFSAGDTISFNRGDTFSGTLTITTSGTNGNPITYGAYGSGAKPIISCTNQRGIYGQNLSYVTVQDLDVNGVGVVAATGLMADGSTNKRFGIDLESTATGGTLAGVKMLRCIVRNCYGGILVHADAATTPVGYSTLELGGDASDPLLVHDCLAMGIWTYGSVAANSSGSTYFLPRGREHSDVHLHHFQVYNIYGIPSAVDSRVNYWGSGVVLSNCTGAAKGDNLIEYGLVHDCGQNNDDGRGGPGNCWTIESDYVTTQFVESYNGKTAGADGGSFDADGGCTHTVYQYCYSHDNHGCGYQTGTYSGNSGTPNDITFQYCLSEKDAHGALTTFNTASTNVVVDHCTFYCEGLVSASSLAVIVLPNPGSAASWTITNCVLLTNDAGNFINLYVYGSPDTAACTVQGNTYHSTAGTDRWQTVNGSGAGIVTTLAAWRASVTASTPEVRSAVNVGQATDPQLVNVSHGGTVGTLGVFTTLTAYDPTSTSSAVANAGVGTTPTGTDFHSRTSSATFLPVGAVFANVVASARGRFASVFAGVVR